MVLLLEGLTIIYWLAYGNLYIHINQLFLLIWWQNHWFWVLEEFWWDAQGLQVWPCGYLWEFFTTAFFFLLLPCLMPKSWIMQDPQQHCGFRIYPEDVAEIGLYSLSISSVKSNKIFIISLGWKTLILKCLINIDKFYRAITDIPKLYEQG